MGMMSNAQSPSYVLACAGTFLALCPVFVGLRFYARSLKSSRFTIDDFLVLPALLLVAGCAIVLVVGVRLQVLGYPTPPLHFSVPNANFTAVQKLQWAFFMMQIVSVGLIKLSFLFLFRKLFITGNGRFFNVFTQVYIFLIISWTLAFFFWELFSCGVPVSNRWRLLDTYLDYCLTDDTSNYALAISDFITDVITLLMPIPLVLRLQITPKRKLLVLVAFGFGVVAIAASAIRLALFVSLYAVANTSRSSAGQTTDPNLIVTEALFWSMLESGLGLIACSLPALSHMVRTTSVNSLIRSAQNSYPLRSLKRSGNGSRTDAETSTTRQSSNAPTPCGREDKSRSLSVINVKPLSNSDGLMV